MAQAFLHGNGGTNPLNFKVVGGTTEPVSPTENTIWINTDVDIPSWVFAAEEPSPAETGMVHLLTGTSSPAAFNALKNNDVQVYPLNAKQYLGGAWVAKNAETYQAGEWHEWIRYLYLGGDEFAYTTGGWVSYTPCTWEKAGMSAKKEATALVLSKTGSGTTASAWPSIGYETDDPINVTGHETLRVRYTSAGTYTTESKISVLLQTNRGENTATSVCAQKIRLTDTLNGEVTLDISGVSGSYYLAIRIEDNRETSSRFVVEITEVSLI